MEKINEYIHLYKGCKCVEIYNGKMLDGFVELDSEFLSYHLQGLREYKLILRPLHDITDKEAQERAWGSQQGFLRYCDYSSPEKGAYRFYPDDFAWLLSKGFDLFNLIPEGLAIDSTTP